jgi:hypothetical protein
MLDECKAHLEEQYVGHFPGLRKNKLSHPNGDLQAAANESIFAARSFS